MDWNAHLPQEPIKIWAALGAVVLALCSGGAFLHSLGYNYGKDISASELSARKAVDDAHIPDITKDFIAANKDLRESLDLFESNKKLNAEIEAYRKQLKEGEKARAEAESAIKELNDRLNAANAEQVALRGQIAKLDGETRQFKVLENHSEKLGDGHVVGVKGTTGTTVLNIIFDDVEYQKSAGGKLPPFEIEGKKCFITIISIDWSATSSGTFELSCSGLPSHD